MSTDRDRRLARRISAWFHENARDLPWRTSPREPYYALVSELMLQQTQVARIVERFTVFIAHFPTIEHLARADEQDVLALWSGLGYYRRAKLLHRAAQAVVEDHGGAMPRTVSDLESRTPTLLIALASTAIVVFLTEMTSNTATATIFVSILTGVAIALGVDPLILIVPATLAASCAFMMPVATPPNAIVYGSGRVTMRQMARAGVWLNLLSIILTVLAAYTVATWVFGIDHTAVPEWALPPRSCLASPTVPPSAGSPPPSAHRPTPS